MTRAVSFQVPFSVILGTFLSFRAFSFVIPSALFCHSEPERGIRSWMLRFAQHDKSGKRGCFAALSMTGWGQQTSPSGPSPCKRRGMFWRKPKQGEVARSSEHFFVIPSIFFCHSKCSFLSFRAPARNPQHGCFAPLSMTRTVSFQTLFLVTPSASEESSAWVPCKRKETFAKQTGGGQSRAWISSRLQRKTPQRTLNT
jgi:hypothetical protein